MKKISKAILSLLLILVLVGCSNSELGLGENIKYSFTIGNEGLEKNTYYVLDRNAFSYDAIVSHDRMRLFSSLQGLINRSAKKNKVVLVLSPENETETFWVDYMKNKGGLLEGKEKKDITTWDEFLTTFKNQLVQCGMVLWDTKVPATANVAATMCGIYGYLPVKDVESGVKADLVKLGVEVKETLTGKFTGKGKIPDTKIDSTGSTKNDAYIWAMEKYMDKCSKQYMMFVPDGASSVPGNIVYENNFEAKRVFGNVNIISHDYGIAKQMFFVDLSPINDKAPVDDPLQKVGTDTETLKKILNKRYERAKGEFGCMVGMPPWQVKYTSYQNMGDVYTVRLESDFVNYLTQYNMYMDGSNSISNTSLYYQFELDSKYENSSKTVTEKYDEKAIYVYYNIASIETSESALNVLEYYNDEKRGETPLTWAINPGLADRVPMVFDYIYKNLSENDIVVASNGGIGSISVSELFLPKEGEQNDGKTTTPRTLESGGENFINTCEPYFQKFNMDMISFLEGSMSDDVYSIFNKIATKGTFYSDFTESPKSVDGIGYFHSTTTLGKVGDIEGVANSMYDYWMNNKSSGNFLATRMNYWTPAQIIQLTTQFEKVVKEKSPDYKVKVVNGYNFMSLAAESGVLN